MSPLGTKNSNSVGKSTPDAPQTPLLVLDGNRRGLYLIGLIERVGVRRRRLPSTDRRSPKSSGPVKPSRPRSFKAWQGMGPYGHMEMARINLGARSAFQPLKDRTMNAPEVIRSPLRRCGRGQYRTVRKDH
jgi:hypothetical protein